MGGLGGEEGDGLLGAGGSTTWFTCLAVANKKSQRVHPRPPIALVETSQRVKRRSPRERFAWEPIQREQSCLHWCSGCTPSAMGVELEGALSGRGAAAVCLPLVRRFRLSFYPRFL